KVLLLLPTYVVPPRIWPVNDACTLKPPAANADGLKEADATPLAAVVPVTGLAAPTVNVTVAPATPAPLAVSVAVNVTGPAAPCGTDAGLTLLSTRAVGTEETTVPPLPLEAEKTVMPIVLCAKAAWYV